jgi:HD-GYP domain-containing protein (c-di-GMP phosphodiesterase class II)
VQEEIQKEKDDLSGFRRKALFKNIEEMFIRFSSILRTAQIYDSNNLAFIGQINPLFSLIQKIINDSGEAVFHLRENTLFINATRVKFDFLSYNRFKLLADELTKKHIGSIAFLPGLDAEELTQFVILLAKTKILDKKDPFEDFKAKMENEEIRHILLDRIHPFEIALSEKPEETKQTAKKVFFKSVSHLKHIFNNGAQQKMLGLKMTRRLIQSLINLISHDEAFMIGLTSIKNYDDYTANHSANVSVLALCFGRRLGLERKELLDVGISAFFHDIGKLEIPKDIIDKKGELTEEEREIMQRHTYYGAGKLICLKEVSYLPLNALYVALEHHVWANFNGYPRHWKKDNINLYSKLIKICDFFDAITTRRPYRGNILNRDEAIALMLEKSGEEFDTNLIKVFVNMVGVYPVGTLVALDSSELGIVVETNSEVAFIIRPKVKLITDSAGNKINGEVVDLTETDRETKQYKRTIIKSLDHEKYGIKPADYFLTQTN